MITLLESKFVTAPVSVITSPVAGFFIVKLRIILNKSTQIEIEFHCNIELLQNCSF